MSYGKGNNASWIHQKTSPQYISQIPKDTHAWHWTPIEAILNWDERWWVAEFTTALRIALTVCAVKTNMPIIFIQMTMLIPLPLPSLSIFLSAFPTLLQKHTANTIERPWGHFWQTSLKTPANRLLPLGNLESNQEAPTWCHRPPGLKFDWVQLILSEVKAKISSIQVLTKSGTNPANSATVIHSHKTDPCCPNPAADIYCW